MIAVDTNVIVRLLTRDDARQYEASLKLFKEEDIFIAETVILETEWVLRYAYEFTPQDICHALRKLFGLSNVTINQPQRIAQVLDWHEAGMDFADAFHVTLSQNHATAMKTFDESFIKMARKLTPLRVEKP